MRQLRLVVAMALIASVAPSAGATAQAPPSPGPVTSPAASHELWLSGPFGRVLGGPLSQPAVSLPGEGALDAFMRSAPMVLDGGSAGIRAKSVLVTSIADPRGTEADDGAILSSGELAFEGPGEPGSWTIVAKLEGADGETSEHAWRIEVPDRDLPDDGLIDIPAPEALLVSDRGSVAGMPGDGCYLYLCVDVGRLPPPSTLPALDARPGEALSAALRDGSAIIAWEGSLEPLFDSQAPVRTSAGAITDELTASVGLVGLQPSSAGEWLLTLKLFFDRERGWMTYGYRVVVE